MVGFPLPPGGIEKVFVGVELDESLEPDWDKNS